VEYVSTAADVLLMCEPYAGDTGWSSPSLGAGGFSPALLGRAPARCPSGGGRGYRDAPPAKRQLQSDERSHGGGVKVLALSLLLLDGAAGLRSPLPAIRLPCGPWRAPV